jgi:hypothetical protein
LLKSLLENNTVHTNWFKSVLIYYMIKVPYLLLLVRVSNRNHEFYELLCVLVVQNRHFHCCARSELPPVWVDLREGGGCTDASSSLLLLLLTGAYIVFFPMYVIRCCGSIVSQDPGNFCTVFRIRRNREFLGLL